MHISCAAFQFCGTLVGLAWGGHQQSRVARGNPCLIYGQESRTCHQFNSARVHPAIMFRSILCTLHLRRDQSIRAALVHEHAREHSSSQKLIRNHSGAKAYRGIHRPLSVSLQHGLWN